MKTNDRFDSNRDEIIMEYAPLVKFIAHRMKGKLPSHIDVEDLINSGVLGLMDAISKFDPTRGIQFKTFAEFRIKGAILDDLRSQDCVSRTVRQKAKKIESVYLDLEHKFGRAATDDEVANALGVDMKEFYRILSQTNMTSLLSLEDLVKNLSQKDRSNFIDSLVSTGDIDPFSYFNLKEMQEIIAQAIEDLPEKERLVIALYYYEELTMKEIGEILDITESRISQIHTKSILHLRAKLKKTYMAS